MLLDKITPEPENSVVFIPFCEIAVHFSSPQRIELARSLEGHIALEQTSYSVFSGGLVSSIEKYAAQPSPDILFIELDDAIEHLQSLSEVLEEKTIVVLFGENNDVNLYKELKSLGVFEYVVTEQSKQDFVQLIQSAAVSIHKGKNGKVTTFLSTGSGSGSSTFAQNTALFLSEATHEKVLYIDLDFSFGNSAIVFNVKHNQEFSELLTRRSIKAFDFQQVCSVVNERLSIIGNAHDFGFFPEKYLESITDVLSYAREFYDHIMIDLPSGWGVLHDHILKRSDKLFVSCFPEVNSFSDLANFSVYFDRELTQIPAFELIINKVKSDQFTKSFVKNVDKILQDIEPIIVSEEPDLFDDALGEHNLPVSLSPKSAFSSEIRTIAQRIHGRDVSPRTSMGFLKRLFAKSA